MSADRGLIGGVIYGLHSYDTAEGVPRCGLPDFGFCNVIRVIAVRAYGVATERLDLLHTSHPNHIVFAAA